MTWIKSTLGEITTILSGTTPKSEVKEYWNGKHVWITPTDLGKLKGIIINTSERFISDEGIESCNLSLVPKNSVVMSSRAPIGHLGIAGTNLYTNQGCKSFVCSSKIDHEYLYFMLKYRMKDIQKLGSGATFEEVSKSSLESFVIYYPNSVNEQQYIVSQVKTQLLVVKKAFTSISIIINESNILRSHILNHIFTNLDSLPKVKIGEIAKVVSKGTTPTSIGLSFSFQGIPFLRAEDVQNNEVDFSKIKLYIDERSHKILSRSELLYGDILITIAGTIGRIGYISKHDTIANCNQAIAFLRFNLDTINPIWLCFLLQSTFYQNIFSKFVVGGAIPNLSLEQLNSIEIPVISITQQNKMAKLISAHLIEVEKTKLSTIQVIEDLNVLPKKILEQHYKIN